MSLRDNTFKNLQEELAKKGYYINDTWYFIEKKSSSYKEVLPLLLKYIPLFDEKKDKEGLIRGISVKGFREAVPILLDEYRKTSFSGLRWVIGHALFIIQDRSIAKEIIVLLEEKPILDPHPKEFEKYDFYIKPPEVSAKETLLAALGATRDPQALPVLLKYLQNPEYAMFAMNGLKFFADPKLIPYLEPLRESSHTQTRNKAKKFIEKLEKMKK